MARILLEDLIKLVEASPRYQTDFDGRTPADVSLRIVIAEGAVSTTADVGLNSTVFESVNGLMVILDVDRDGVVRMVEFH